jgi:hypothetical protein
LNPVGDAYFTTDDGNKYMVCNFIPTGLEAAMTNRRNGQNHSSYIPKGIAPSADDFRPKESRQKIYRTLFPPKRKIGDI